MRKISVAVIITSNQRLGESKQRVVLFVTTMEQLL